MKKLISLILMFFQLFMHFPLVSCFKDERLKQCHERVTIISGLKLHLGLTDKNYFSNLQPIFDDNCNLVLNDIDSLKFNDEQYLTNVFLDEQKRTKNAFMFHVLTTFLKLNYGESGKFDLSDIAIKFTDITYFKITTKTLSNDSKKIIVLTEGVIRITFVNKVSNVEIQSFYSPVKDMEVDIFSNVEQDCSISGFEINKTLTDVKIEFSQNALLVRKLRTILQNYSINKLDNLINYNVKLNFEKSSNRSSQQVFKTGDFIDIEIILSIPNGTISEFKKNKSLTNLAMILTKEVL